LEGTDIKSASREKPALPDFLVEAGEVQLYRTQIILHNLKEQRASVLVFN